MLGLGFLQTSDVEDKTDVEEGQQKKKTDHDQRARPPIEPSTSGTGLGKNKQSQSQSRNSDDSVIAEKKQQGSGEQSNHGKQINNNKYF